MTSMANSPHHADAKRFVVLFHQPGIASKRTAKPHYDWMFEFGGQLLTWATAPTELGIESMQVGDPIEADCEPLPPHRLDYLDYEGEVSGGRGSVTRRLAGHYVLKQFGNDLFHAELTWTQQVRTGVEASRASGTLASRVWVAQLSIYRRFFPDDDGRLAESRESWLLRFSLGR